MEWLKKYDIFLQSLILSSIIILILSIVLIFLYLFNIKTSKNNIKYVYAFSSGFMIVTAIVGQWVSARTMLINHNHNEEILKTLIYMTIFAFSIIIGSIFAFLIKRYSSKIEHTHLINNEKHIEGHKHAQIHTHLLDTKDEKIIEFKKNKNTLIYMILTHRLPAGLILGILLVNFNYRGTEFALSVLITFIFHIVPEIVIIYFAKIENNQNKKQAFIFTFFTKLLIIPFIFIGVLLTKYVNIKSEIMFWIIPMLLIISGVVMIWGSTFELGPIFIHIFEDKQTYRVIFAFIIGLSISMIIQFIHFH